MRASSIAMRRSTRSRLSSVGPGSVCSDIFPHYPPDHFCLRTVILKNRCAGALPTRGVAGLHPIALIVQFHDERDLGLSGLVTPFKPVVGNLELGVEIA